MTARQRLDRKTRWTVALIIAMIIAIPVLAVRSYIGRVTAETMTVIPSQADERLVSIDGRKTLGEPGSLGRAMADWFDTAKEKTFEFELSGRSFMPGSAEPSGTT